MLKKGLIAAVIFYVGYTLKDIKSGEKIYWEDSIMLLVIAVVIFIFAEWVAVPYEWDKHKNKNKDKQNLS